MVNRFNKIYLSIASLGLVVSCQTNYLDNNQVQETVIDENIGFEDFLENQWEQNLEDSPIFASLLGNKKFNQDITSNNIKTFESNKLKLKIALNSLNSFNYNQLNSANKLNYQLKEISLSNAIEASYYPSYYLSLNQRGGVQSYYETGDRLVYSSKQDYEDWLLRLSKYVDNIINTKNNLEKGIQNGYTHPRLVTSQVITQIDNILNSNIEDNPYLKILMQAKMLRFLEP